MEHKRDERGFHHLSLLLLILVLAVVGLVGLRVLKTNEQPNQSAERAIVYERKQPAVIKAILDPTYDEVLELVTQELDKVRALGVNTVYVYVDYSYKDGKLQLTEEGRGRLNQAQLEQAHADTIVAVKKAGFAVHLTIAFGGGKGAAFGVPREQLFNDIEAIDLKWAKIGDQYMVETYAPSSEIDYQIFREYYASDWSDRAKHDAAAKASNDYHDRVLPKLRQVFGGKLIYQAGLHSSKLCSRGYDYFGQGINNVGAELVDWPAGVEKLFGYAEANAKCSGSGWLVTELWLPTHEIGQGAGPGKARTTKNGTPMSEVQHEYYKIVFDKYKAYAGQIKPSGLGFTSYLNPTATVKDRPAETLIKDFFLSL